MIGLTGKELIQELPAKERSLIELAVYKYFALNHPECSKSAICKMSDNVMQSKLCDIATIVNWREIVK